MEERIRRSPGREVLWAAWAAVLTPCVHLLPGALARMAGSAAWLSPLVALPGVLLLSALPGRIVREDEDGFVDAVRRLLGRGAGNAVLLIYITWAVVLSGARLRLGGQYFLSAVGQEGRLWPVLLPVAAMAAWLAGKKPDAVVRAGAIFGRILGAGLIGWIGLTALGVRAENLWPLSPGSIPGALKAGGLTLGLLCAGIYGAFYPWTPSRGRSARAAALGGAPVLVTVCVLGNLGAALAAQSEDAFLLLSRGVGLEGAVRRTESLAAALGLLSDLALAALLLGAGRRLIHLLTGDRAGMAPAVAAVVLAATVFYRAESARRFALSAAPVGNLILGLGIPGALYLLEYRRKREERGGISCDVKQEKTEDVVTDSKAKKSLPKGAKKC